MTGSRVGNRTYALTGKGFQQKNEDTQKTVVWKQFRNPQLLARDEGESVHGAPGQRAVRNEAQRGNHVSSSICVVTVLGRKEKKKHARKGT